MKKTIRYKSNLTTRGTVRKRARPRNLEDKECIALMVWVMIKEKTCPDLKWFHHIPNGGDRNPIVAGKLKAMGVRKGIHDYFHPCRRSIWSGLYIEMKAGEGRPTTEQKEFLGYVTSQGYYSVVCNGWYAAVEVIKEYLSLPCNYKLVPDMTMENLVKTVLDPKVVAKLKKMKKGK